MKRMDKYFFITVQKEQSDSIQLIECIKKDGWVDNDVIIINCSPDYSSRVVQLTNHKLSYLNGNELFEVIDLPMPYPTMSQIWNPQSHKYELFDRYLIDWARQHINKNHKYLFVDSGTIRGKNFNKLKMVTRNILEPLQYRFASLYKEEKSIFNPDYYVEIYSNEKQGGLLFEWENTNNPNWDY